jgi:acyl carrier protein
MDDAHARLVMCFSNVFPSLPTAEIPTTSMISVEEWDSVATVTLLVVIEEEFEVQFEPGDLEVMVSFDSVWNQLRKYKGYA